MFFALFVAAKPSRAATDLLQYADKNCPDLISTISRWQAPAKWADLRKSDTNLISGLKEYASGVRNGCTSTQQDTCGSDVKANPPSGASAEGGSDGCHHVAAALEHFRCILPGIQRLQPQDLKDIRFERTYLMVVRSLTTQRNNPLWYDQTLEMRDVAEKLALEIRGTLEKQQKPERRLLLDLISLEKELYKLQISKVGLHSLVLTEVNKKGERKSIPLSNEVLNAAKLSLRRVDIDLVGDSGKSRKIDLRQGFFYLPVGSYELTLNLCHPTSYLKKTKRWDVRTDTIWTACEKNVSRTCQLVSLSKDIVRTREDDAARLTEHRDRALSMIKEGKMCAARQEQVEFELQPTPPYQRGWFIASAAMLAGTALAIGIGYALTPPLVELK